MQIRKDGFSVRETADKLQVTEEQGGLTVENSRVTAKFSTVFGKLISFGKDG